MQNFTDAEIGKAKEVAYENLRLHPKAPEGFWHEGVYIVSPFLDKTGTRGLTKDEMLACYGEENVERFIRLAVEKYPSPFQTKG